MLDVTTVAKVKHELKGWRLNRCVFVGDTERQRHHRAHVLAENEWKMTETGHAGLPRLHLY